ncbi:hypothetical protein [Xylella taiwanensis]|nr:hypothetical protein [Xylella taiwanensis]UFN04090.1 hypothetical protein LPH41_09535 [Xylella taiwanensis]UFN19872.1 hypothetical protein LPH58_08630 [Xylella taiwanensis]
MRRDFPSSGCRAQLDLDTLYQRIACVHLYSLAWIGIDDRNVPLMTNATWPLHDVPAQPTIKTVSSHDET